MRCPGRRYPLFLRCSRQCVFSLPPSIFFTVDHAAHRCRRRSAEWVRRRTLLGLTGYGCLWEEAPDDGWTVGGVDVAASLQKASCARGSHATPNPVRMSYKSGNRQPGRKADWLIGQYQPKVIRKV